MQVMETTNSDRKVVKIFLEIQNLRLFPFKIGTPSPEWEKNLSLKRTLPTAPMLSHMLRILGTQFTQDCLFEKLVQLVGEFTSKLCYMPL